MANSPASSLLLGCALAAVGNTIAGASYALQKMGHARAADILPFYKSRLWLYGTTLMILGETCNFLAYGYAPASLIAPTGALAVVVNGLVAHEKTLRGMVMGMGATLVGTACVFASASPVDGITEADAEVSSTQVTRTAALLSYTFLVNAAAALYVASTVHGGERPLVYASLCACTSALGVVGGKYASTVWQQGLFLGVIPYTPLELAMSVLALVAPVGAQLFFFNKGLSHFSVSSFIPVSFVLFVTVTVTESMIVYGSFFGGSWLRGFLFFLGCCLDCVGVWAISASQASLGRTHRALFLFCDKAKRQACDNSLVLADAQGE